MTWRKPQGVLGELVGQARLAVGRRPKPSPPLPRPSTRFRTALEQAEGFPLICEVKRASPSAGALSLLADAPQVARTYAAAGAACVSVLTEESRFGGRLEDLSAVGRAVAVPLLRKDFIVDVQMVEEAAAAGAAAVLLIAAAVEPAALLELAAAAEALGLDVLLELIYDRDLEVLGLRSWPLVGINARDLETLEVDPARFETLAPRASLPGRLLVAESALRSATDVRRVRLAGAGAGLVGESLMRSPDPAALIQSLRWA